MTKYKPGNNGFTLLEVMIAIMVLTIGLLGAAAMQLNSINRNSEAFNITKATNLALDQIEQILSWDPTDARLNDNTLAGAGINFNRTGLLRGANPDANRLIRTVADVADTQAQANDFTIFYDITPRNDPVNGFLVGLDAQVYVVWNEGTRLKTIAMSTTKVL